MRDELTGVLNLAKPVGLTSHDVVSRIRRLSRQKAVGHAGTLDPLAQGVLVILLGRATVLSALAMASTKVYAAEVVLGTGTTTDDAEGSICAIKPVPDLTEEKIRDALAPLRGHILQTPPRFSAIKTGGKTAYIEARKGRQVDLAPREVHVKSLEILSWKSPRLRLLISTGPGTYVRSLARDAGQLLSTEAYLHSLIRLSSGHFSLKDAIAVEANTDRLLDGVLPADSVVRHLPAAFISAQDTARVRHGGAVNQNNHDLVEGEVVRLYSSKGSFLALGRSHGSLLQPFRVLEPAA